MTERGSLSQKDLKRFKKTLEDSRKALLESARKTMEEESNFDTDDLPDEALARIEDGTFGVCERCEEPISLKRLEARPVTTLCIRCKEEQEKKEKSYG